MKRRGRCALFFMLVLALGVAARETPEILELGDDVSNDGLVAATGSFLPQPPSRSLYRREPGWPALSRPSAAPKVSQRHFWFGPSLDASPKAGRDILKLLSLERE